MDKNVVDVLDCSNDGLVEAERTGSCSLFDEDDIDEPDPLDWSEDDCTAIFEQKGMELHSALRSLWLK